MGARLPDWGRLRMVTLQLTTPDFGVEPPRVTPATAGRGA